MTEIAEGRGFTKAEIDKQKKIVENAYKTMDSHATYPHGENYKKAAHIHEKEEEKLATMLRHPIKATDKEHSREELKAQKKLKAQLFSIYDVVEDKTKGLRDVSKHRREQLEKISGKLNVMEQKVEDLERNVQGWKGKHEKFKEELLVRKQEINQLKENAQQRVEKLSNRGDKQDQMQNSNKTNRTSRG